MDGLTVSNLVKRFGEDTAIRDISFRVEPGEIVALLGPSGCGKTTTLRSIAGLETPTSGSITLDSHVLFASERNIDVSPEKRGIGLVFQSYALWPHMTVFENVAYGLRVARVPRDELRARVTEILATVELSGTESRYPATLSGGQQQRVALARSLVMKPKMLLFDEPLSNLDLKLRESMRHELRQVMKQTGLTCVYVTHDQQEAMVVADKMILMHDGVVEQADTPRNVYAHPATEFAAKFVGSVNLFAVDSIEPRGKVVELTLEGGTRLTVEGAGPTSPGASYSAVIRPEWVRFVAAGERADNVLAAQVLDMTFLGNLTYYDLDCSGLRLRVQATTADHGVGDAVTISIPPSRIALVAR